MNPGVEDPGLRDYLQRIVGNRGRTMVTSALRFPSWADLPWDDTLPKPKPLPIGSAVLIGMRDTFLGLPGPEGFIAIQGDMDHTLIALALAENLIQARTGGM